MVEVLDPDLLVRLCQNEGPFDRVLQLAHVSRPGIVAQEVGGFEAKHLSHRTGLFAKCQQEMLRERKNIF